MIAIKNMKLYTILILSLISTISTGFFCQHEGFNLGEKHLVECPPMSYGCQSVFFSKFLYVRCECDTKKVSKFWWKFNLTKSCPN